MLSGSDLAGLNDFADKAVVLIGTGPANLGLAEVLTDSGINTLLIEGGESDFSTRSQELYDGQSVGSYHLPYGLSGSRMRFLGGSSNCWAGGCGVLSDIDFKPRPWIPNSGWPISGADLTPYYEDAYGFFSLRPDYDALSENLLKFKNLISAIVYSNEAATPNNTKVQTASTDSIANQEENASIFTENLAKLIISKLKETNTIQVPNDKTDCNASKPDDTKETNEINILNFFSGLQNKLEISKKSIQTSSTNLINLETSVDVDKSTLMLNGK